MTPLDTLTILVVGIADYLANMTAAEGVRMLVGLVFMGFWLVLIVLQRILRKL